MNVKDRIRKYIEFENLTISAFEKSIEASNGYVNSISKSIGLDKLVLILECYPKLSLEWLLTGKGSMLKSESIVNGNINSQIAQNVNGGVSQVQGSGENSVSLLQQENTFLKEKIALLEQNIQLLKELKEK